MKKTFKAILTACLLLLAVCGASLSVSAYSFYGGIIVVDPSFPNTVYDANDEIEIPFTVTRYTDNKVTSSLSSYYCDIYGPNGRRISHTYGYLKDMDSMVLHWKVFDTSTPHDIGEYTVKYYTDTNQGSSCHFYVNSASGTFGSGMKWSFNNDTKELVISGSGNITDDNLPWRDYRESIKTITIKEGVTSIGEYTFWKYYSSLTTVNLPTTLTQIGRSAFDECRNLTTINFPEGLMQIGDYAFQDCSFLQNIKLPSTLRTIGCNTFEGTAIKEIEIPSGVAILRSNVFANCYYLEKITIPNTVKSIEFYAFDNCSSLKTIVYNGTKNEWSRINIDSFKNDALTSATLKTPSKVTLSKTKLKSLTNDASGIKITWNKVSNAKGYYIYRKTGTSKTWTKIATIKKGTTVSYLDKKSLTNGTSYTYMVKAYSGSTTSTGTTLTTVRLTRPTISSCTSKSRAATLKWKRNAKATGYEIKYTYGSTSKTIRVKKNATVKAVIKNLKKGKTYTFNIRSYKTVGGKTYYSSWSPAKKCTVR